MDRADATVEKIMALTLADFHRGIRALAPDVAVGEGQTEFEISEADQMVRIHFEPLDNTTLGGLLALPRARVTIHATELDPERRQAFLARFDQAFQRGGG